MLFSLLIQTRSRILFDVFCLLFQTFVSDFWFDFWTHHCTVTYAYYENFELVWMRIYSAFLCVRRTKKNQDEKNSDDFLTKKNMSESGSLMKPDESSTYHFNRLFLHRVWSDWTNQFFLLKSKLRKPCPHTYVLVPRLITDQKVFKNFLQ